MENRYKVKVIWLRIVFMIFPFTLGFREPVWHPEEPGTPMSEYVINYDGVYRAAYWAEHAGFILKICDNLTFNNLSQAPQVQINLDEDPIHLQNRNFTIQTRVKLNTPGIDTYFAGLCIYFDNGDTLMFGRVGLNTLRLEYNDSINEQEYTGDAVYIKIKRLDNRYAVWFSEDCQIWTLMVTELIEAIPVFAGAALRNWGEPQEVEVEFKHFDIMHVENEPEEFVPNYWYGEDPNERLHFIYDLSGIDIAFHLYLRHANDNEPYYQDRKMYYIHGSAPSNGLYDPSNKIRVFIDQNLLGNDNDPNQMNMLYLAPTYFDGNHPYFGYRFQYRSLRGEQDWMLIDLHENYIRERFPATQSENDDKFYLCGSSAGGQFVNRFCMAHAKKLHAAVTRAAGAVTFPTYEMYWPSGLDISSFAEKNPRLTPDLDSLKELKVASMVGENDNELPLPNLQLIRYSPYDSMRKWIRKITMACGDIAGECFIIPFAGHGYGYVSRRLTLKYFFGNEADLEEISQWKYTFEIGPQDEKISLKAEDVPDEMFYYTRFQSWVMPGASAEKCYEFFPEGLCHVLDIYGRYKKTTSWSVSRQNGELYVVVDGRVYGSPYRQYGKLSLNTGDEKYLLEQCAFVTERFINDCVVNRIFYVFEGTGRDSNGPICSISYDYYPFRLRADGVVQGAWEPQRTPTNIISTMRHWSFDREQALLRFTDSSEQEYNFLQIGEWRWNINDSGVELVAGLHTKDSDERRLEIRSENYYDPRCFEEWEYTWPTGEHDNTKTIYVDDDAPGNQDGTNWQNAMTKLQDALDIVRFGDTIKVAQGTYRPTSANGDRSISFAMVNGVVMEGGYAGYGQDNPDIRNISLYETVLSGDLNGDDQLGFSNNDENSYNVLTATKVESMTVLNGFTIIGGNANGPNETESTGGGLRNQSAEPLIKNCIFMQNFGVWGGAIENSWSSPIIENCRFINNKAYKGGAISIVRSTPLIVNCLFEGNRAEPDGGAIISRAISTVKLSGCTIVGNKATWGPAFLIFDESNLKLTNSIVWDNNNLDGSHSSEQIRKVNSTLEALYNCIQGSIDPSNGKGNITSDPLFRDIALNDYNLKVESPCIDAGDPDYEAEVDECDLDGRPRIYNGRVDIGAYEYYPEDITEKLF